jgi:N6-adenosine-specific RNA methylase IME4
MKKYKIILSDCPWHYNSRANHKTRFRGGVHGHYQTMKLKELKALPIADLADENSAIFHWCTFPMLKEGIEVMEAWGFKYKTLGFSWTKLNKNNGEPFFGVGFYAKSNAEVCLLGIKGKMKPVSNKVSSCIISPRREHSRKPDEVYERIEELYGDVPRIELFARNTRPGWDSMGNGIDGQDIREVLTA